MEIKDIKSSNKLIAEFMGATSYKHGIFDAVNFSEKTEEGFKSYDLIYLKYNSSWDWLMPVVKKALEITSEFQYDDEEYLYITEEIFYPDNTLSEFMNNNITDIWRRVVEFIKWYNKSNDKTKTSTKITV